jgi:hypothetical protein
MRLEQEVPKPSLDELPPYTRRMEVFMVLVILLFGVVLNFSIFTPNKEEIVARWIDECIEALNNTEGSANWRRKSDWPPDSSTTIVSAIQPENRFYNYDHLLVEKSRVIVGEHIRLSYRDLLEDFEDLRQANPETYWLSIIGINNLVALSLEVSYWTPDLKGIPVFRFVRTRGPISLYWRPLINLTLMIFVAWMTRFLLVERYRKKREQAYEAFQSQRTAAKFAAEAKLEEARQLAKSGQIAKAISVVNTVLRTMPRSIEANELKRLLMQVQDVGSADLTVPLESIPSSVLTSTPTLLYLQILGTPYAYQAPPGVKSVVIGRQRRKPGASQDVGSDVVIRVPGSDAKSLRISRRHLEIRRIDTDYFAIDMSNGNTKHNGKVLTAGKPVQLRSGDRLMVAGVLTLKVLIRLGISGSRAGNIIQISPTAEGQNALLIEATVGDMLTEVADEL